MLWKSCVLTLVFFFLIVLSVSFSVQTIIHGLDVHDDASDGWRTSWGEGGVAGCQILGGGQKYLIPTSEAAQSVGSHGACAQCLVEVAGRASFVYGLQVNASHVQLKPWQLSAPVGLVAHTFSWQSVSRQFTTREDGSDRWVEARALLTDAQYTACQEAFLALVCALNASPCEPSPPASSLSSNVTRSIGRMNVRRSVRTRLASACGAALPSVWTHPWPDDPRQNTSFDLYFPPGGQLPDTEVERDARDTEQSDGGSAVRLAGRYVDWLGQSDDFLRSLSHATTLGPTTVGGNLTYGELGQIRGGARGSGAEVRTAATVILALSLSLSLSLSCCFIVTRIASERRWKWVR